MYIPIRQGYSIDSSDKSRISKLQEFEIEGFITTAKMESISCNKCNTDIPNPKNNIENFVRCPVCKKLVNLYRKKESHILEQINYNKITEHISNLLSKGNHDFQFDEHRFCWFVNIDNKTLPILIPEISNANLIVSYSEKESSMFITLDSDRHNNLITTMNKAQFIEFQNIINDQKKLSETVKTIVTTFEPNSSIELEQKFDHLLENVDGFKFEDFSVKFLEEIQKSDEKLRQFYSYLSRMKKTIINSKIIKVGGPGNPDFRTIDLLDYLQSGLRPDLYGEAKRYGKTTSFSFAQYSSAIMRGQTEDTLFLVSTNNIPPQVWMSIFDFEKDGSYKYVLLDKDLILTLIKCLDLKHLIEDYK